MRTPLPPSRLLAHRLVHAGLQWVDRVGEVVPGTPLARGFGGFGAGTCIDFPPATLLNTHAIHLGDDTLIGRSATLAAGYAVGDPRLPERALVVGDRCLLGARLTVLAHERVELGDDVFFGQGVFVTDSSHGYQDPSRPVGAQFGTHDPVTVGSGSWVGHGAVLLPGARLGRNVVVAAGAVVRGEVEDHAVVAGNPARVVRRLEPGVGWVSASGDVRAVADPGPATAST